MQNQFPVLFFYVQHILHQSPEGATQHNIGHRPMNTEGEMSTEGEHKEQ
jgi:hypothetical protein